MALVGERRDASKVLVGDFREKDHLDGVNIDDEIVLRWIFKN